MFVFQITVVSAKDQKENKSRRRKRNEERFPIYIPALEELYHYVVDDLVPGESYKVKMSVRTALGRIYYSPEESVLLQTSVDDGKKPIASEKKSLMKRIKDFIIQPWFLGVLGGVIVILVLFLLLCCICRRSSSKKDADDLPIELENTNHPEAVRKAPR